MAHGQTQMNIEGQNRLNNIIQKQLMSSESICISVWREIYLYCMVMIKYFTLKQKKTRERIANDIRHIDITYLWTGSPDLQKN